MREVTGDLFETPADAICLTTNGTVASGGRGVMGAGVAKQAVLRWSVLPTRLGAHLRINGNAVGVLARKDTLYRLPYDLVAFPVKHHWHQAADPDLIAQSVVELVELADEEGWQRIALPRPGCGNGRLRWDDVKPFLAWLLDERFLVVNNDA